MINVYPNKHIMSDKYKMYEPDKAYFLTLTVVDWIYIFSKEKFKAKIIESLKYCQDHKNLEVYGCCMMSNHLHLITRAGGLFSLSDILRDFKKFTARVILQELQEDPENKNDFWLTSFENKAKPLKRVKKY
jgi:putative transposase